MIGLEVTPRPGGCSACSGCVEACQDCSAAMLAECFDSVKFGWANASLAAGSGGGISAPAARRLRREALSVPAARRSGESRSSAADMLCDKSAAAPAVFNGARADNGVPRDAEVPRERWPRLAACDGLPT